MTHGPWSPLVICPALPDQVKPWSPLVSAQNSVSVRWSGTEWVPCSVTLFDE